MMKKAAQFLRIVQLFCFISASFLLLNAFFIFKNMVLVKKRH